MRLNKEVKIWVFELNNKNFECIGQLNDFSNLIWKSNFVGYSDFELWAPFIKETANLLKKGNTIWLGGEKAAIIEIIKIESDENGVKRMNVKGRTLEAFLTTRIIWSTQYIYRENISSILYKITKEAFSSSIGIYGDRRNLPFLKFAEDKKFGNKITIWKAMGDLYDFLVSTSQAEDLGFGINFNPKRKEMVFEIKKGTDRTINQSIVDPIELRTDLEDILFSSYYSNSQNFKNIALVAGEGELAARKRQIAGDDNLIGFNRRELFVDARDLQTETIDSQGNSITIPEQEYNNMLINRGFEKLAEHKDTEVYEAEIRIFGDVQYEFGKDYFLGDKITITDKNLGVTLSATISEIEEVFGENYSLTLTFGYSYPTLFQVIKEKLL